MALFGPHEELTLLLANVSRKQLPGLKVHYRERMNLVPGKVSLGHDQLITNVVMHNEQKFLLSVDISDAQYFYLGLQFETLRRAAYQEFTLVFSFPSAGRNEVLSVKATDVLTYHTLVLSGKEVRKMISKEVIEAYNGKKKDKGGLQLKESEFYFSLICAEPLLYQVSVEISDQLSVNVEELLFTRVSG